MKMTDDRAVVSQVLLWYDQPEILLLKRGSIEFILAVSDGSSDNDEPSFVGASMTLQLLSDYQAEKCDLRYALAHANLRRYWRFSFTGTETEVDLHRVRKTSAVVIQSLPESGFFAREHEKIQLVEQFVADAEEQFDIDGSWELGEFSKFYGQVEDIYYIFSDLVRFNDPSVAAPTKQMISKAFERPWRGGGSYVAFYDKIANDNAPIAKLKVSGIRYHSPGYVAVKAKKEPFDAIIALLQAYAHRTSETRKAYIALQKFLSFSGLLRPDTNNLATDTIRDATVDYAKALQSLMPGVSYNTLVRMADGNEIIAAKVLMSIFRRMERLYEFFEEGRVRYSGLETDPLLGSEEDLDLN
jgi:hypothetical protein